MSNLAEKKAKPDYTLLPWAALDDVVAVMEYGARKYERDGWRAVERHEYVKATMRHLAAIGRGEDIDPESGLTHFAHLAADALIVIALDK